MFVLHTPWVSPHQVPLAKKLVNLLGEENFYYIYTEAPAPHHINWGWDKLISEPWMKKSSPDDPILKTCDVLLTGGTRDLAFWEARGRKGLKTLYMSERWFKPMRIGGAEGIGLPISGWMKLLVPSYRKMVKRFVRWANTDPGARVLAIGPWAWADFIRMGVKEEKLVKWGYFVSPGVGKRCRCGKKGEPLKVLWAGRDLAWKRVKDIESAVALANKDLTTDVHLHLNYTPITFTKLTGVTGDEVRKAMREHDVFVMASDAYEGWGAVVSEALEEGMNVIGTYEAGASAAMLPKERLYHCGDVKALARLLEAEYCGTLPPCSIGDWTAKKAAERLCALAREACAV